VKFILEAPIQTGMILSVFSLGLFIGLFAITATFAQNVSTTNGTVIVEASPNDSITSLIEVISAIGILLGAIGTVLAYFGNDRVNKASKFLITIGQKAVEETHVIERVVRATDAMSGGKLKPELDKVKMPMEKIRDHARAATEQLNYLKPNETLPNSPEKDTSMPREGSKMPRTLED
jgi:hypothetical protein